MKELQQVKFNDELILTTEQLAEFYGTTSRRIQENFKRNKDKFIEGKHFYLISNDLLKRFKNQYAKSGLVNEHVSSLYLWTKRGASRHSKMLGTDQAWNMYDRLEENYFNQEQKALNVSKLSPELQMFKGLFDSVASQELRIQHFESHQNETDKKLNSISEIVGTSTLDWKNATSHLINKIAGIMGNTVEAHRNIRNEIYSDVDRRGGVNLNIRLTNLKRRMALEGASKTKIGKTNRVDVIAQDKKLVEIYMAIVKEYAIKYDVWNNDFDNRKDA